MIDQLKAVTASLVIGLKDDKWGEKVAAAVVPKKKNSITKEEIMDHCKSHLHPWKCPKQIVLVNELPKTQW